jgi:hypothetical protein
MEPKRRFIEAIMKIFLGLYRRSIGINTLRNEAAESHARQPRLSISKVSAVGSRQSILRMNMRYCKASKHSNGGWRSRDHCRACQAIQLPTPSTSNVLLSRLNLQPSPGVLPLRFTSLCRRKRAFSTQGQKMSTMGRGRHSCESLREPAIKPECRVRLIS